MNHPDHIAGRLLAVGVLAALAEREVSGEGQHIELAQTEASAYLIGEKYLQAARDGVAQGDLSAREGASRQYDAGTHGAWRTGVHPQWCASL
jgi:crotonobetainyl-CoA:carnitine CoA-transferase CaiB-like acyl-CoA transferase